MRCVTKQVTEEELEELRSIKLDGPIVYLTNTTQTTSLWSKFLDLEQHQRFAHLKRIVFSEDQSNQLSEEQEKEKESRWSWRNLLHSIFSDDENKKKESSRKTTKGPDPYNIHDRKPDFKNDYGYSKALDESDFPQLSDSNIGVYFVYLKAVKPLLSKFSK